MPNLPREVLLDYCRRMLVIRLFEEALIGLHHEGRFKGHYHVYIGQEATGVAALGCVENGDHLFTTHRNHGHLLARGADPARLLAEILGRRDGYNKGKGGTFHTSSADLGFLHTSAVVAGIIPLATGAAYSAKVQKNGRIAVCLFGDGALEEAAAAESFNLASLSKLPVLYLCENNGKYGHGRATGAAQSSTMAAFPLTDLPKAYRIPAEQVDGTDTGAVHALVAEAVRRIRRGEGPQFIEAQTMRWPGNEASWPMVPAPTEIALAWEVGTVPEAAREWYRHSDPVLILIRELVESKRATRQEIDDVHQNVRAQIAAAVKFAFESPYPDPQEALKDVFAGR
ncbi:MAG: ABC transporter substrate-binding protein [Deltaproteobacteria bacterium]|nr:ABC transporter substrate-binding protein [Deltaproteobacteria bacterium]